MLTDLQIKELCKKMEIPLEGVFFKDQLPKKIKPNMAYIINMENALDENGRPNDGSHWTCLQVNKYPNGSIEPFYFDSYGSPAAENVKKVVMNTFGQKLPFSKRDIQSLMNNACGFYCCGLLHFINASKYRTGNFYEDIENFLCMFDDLNESVDWKKNEYILKHFFQPSDPKLRKKIEIDIEPARIVQEDSGEGMNIMEVPVKMVKK